MALFRSRRELDDADPVVFKRYDFLLGEKQPGMSFLEIHGKLVKFSEKSWEFMGVIRNLQPF